MCFRGALRRRRPPPPSARPASSRPACLPVCWDDVYNNGGRQSNFTQHARHGSHLSAPHRATFEKRRDWTATSSCAGATTCEWGGWVGVAGVEACHTWPSDTISPRLGRPSKWRNMVLLCGCFSAARAGRRGASCTMIKKKNWLKF